MKQEDIDKIMAEADKRLEDFIYEMEHNLFIRKEFLSRLPDNQLKHFYFKSIGASSVIIRTKRYGVLSIDSALLHDETRKRHFRTGWGSHVYKPKRAF